MELAARLKAYAPKLNAIGHYVEQPQVIRTVGQKAGLYGGLGGMALLAAGDTITASPNERAKTLTRDALVLGATGLGTVLATKHFMPLPTEKEAEKAVELLNGKLKKLLAENQGLYSNLAGLTKSLEGKAKLEVADFQQIFDEIKKYPKTAKQHLQQIFGGEDDSPGIWKTITKEMWQEGNPAEGIEEGEGRKMGAFFTVGGLSVLSGLAGGILANKVNGVKDPDATVNMVKEGIFQFVANIALCAVGASAAIIGMSPKPIAQRLANMGMTGKLIKTAGIGAGLSLGIFGGGVIANKVGSNYVNPLCDKIQGKAPQPVAEPNQGKRKIEFWDAILHLDDVPTALALAGMEIVEPFIPLFFAFSGYRTGIGYRNDDSKAQSKSPQLQELSGASFSGKQAQPKRFTPAPVIPNYYRNSNGFYQ